MKAGIFDGCCRNFARIIIGLLMITAAEISNDLEQIAEKVKAGQRITDEEGCKRKTAWQQNLFQPQLSY
jgi:hypothetical protein